MMAANGQQRQVRGRRATCSVFEMISQDTNILSLPEHLLKRILFETASGYSLRYVCKAFSRAVAESALSIRLPLHVLRDAQRLQGALLTYKNAGSIILEVSKRQEATVTEHSTARNTDVRPVGELVACTLDALASARHPVTSLAVRGLSQPLRLPSTATLNYLVSCGLTELELQDVSIQQASHEGAANILRPLPMPLSSFESDAIFGQPAITDSGSESWGPDSIRARSAAMVGLAVALPSLRRLSLTNAAFSASDVAALGSLSQLEELSLVGAMECDAGSSGGDGHSCTRASSEMPTAATAEAAYRALLRGLPHLRRVRLPLAISGQAAASFWHDDDDEDDTNGEDKNTSQPSIFSLIAPGRASSISAGGSSTCIGSSGSDRGRVCSGQGSSVWSAAFSSGSFSSCVGAEHAVRDAGKHGTAAPGLVPSVGSTRTVLPPGTTSSQRMPLGAVLFQSGTPARPATSISDQPNPAAACGLRLAGGSAVHFGDPADTRSLSVLAAAAAGCVPPPAPGCGPSSALDSQWRLPPLLEELTIPLCALNGPIFHAACEAYGSQDGRCSHLRVLHIPCAPGYTAWEGSFLNSEHSFRCLSQLASLETLHLSLELGASGRRPLRRDSLRASLRHLRALHSLQDFRISETHQPVCFATRKGNGGAPSLLSYILDPYDAPRAPPCTGVRLPLPRLLLGEDPEMPAPPGRSQSLAPWAAASALPRLPSTAALTGLLTHWPQLQRLVVGEQTVVRTSLGGQHRLLLAGSPDHELALAEGDQWDRSRQLLQQARHCQQRQKEPWKENWMTCPGLFAAQEQRCRFAFYLNCPCCSSSAV